MPITIAQAVFGIYLLGVLLVGVVASRYTEHTPTDFYLANRTVGTVILSLTLVATILSAFTVFGIGANVVGTGLGQFGFLSLAAVFYALLFSTVGVSLYRVGKRMNIVTPSEYVRNRYDNSMVGVTYLGVTGIFMIAMITGQLVGGGVALEILVGIPYLPAILLMAVFMIVYIHIAGYRGVIWSDALQAGILFSVLGGVFFWVLFSLGSAEVSQGAMDAVPGIFDLVGPIGLWSPLYVLTIMLAFGFGVPAYPQSIQRYFSAGNASTMRDAGFLYVLIAVPTYFFAAALGAWSLGIIPTPENTDYVIPLFIEAITHPVVFGIAIGGATAAIMSTADSVALTMSSMVSRDVYREYLHPEASESREVRVTQAMVILVVILALILAWIRPAGIFEIVAFAVVGFATTSAPVFLGVYWDGGTDTGAIASLIFGPGITILFFLEYIPIEYTFGMHYGFIGVIIAYVLFIVGSLLTPKPITNTIEHHTTSFFDDAD